MLPFMPALIGGQGVQERGVLGIHSLNAQSVLARNTTRLRLFALLTSLALLMSFIVASALVPSGSFVVSGSAENMTLSVAAFAYAICAYLLFSRLVLSRSPGLCVLATSFLLVATLMLAQAFSTKVVMSDWLQVCWLSALSLGLIIFAMVEHEWDMVQQRAALHGYYSEDRLRFVRLPLDRAARWIGAGLLTAALVGGAAMLDATEASCCSGLITSSGAKALAAGALLFVAVGFLVVLAWRKARSAPSAYRIGATIGGVTVLFLVLPACGTRLLAGASLVVWPGMWLHVATIAAAFAALLMLVALRGQRTVFRTWLLLAAIANLMTAVAAIGSTLVPLGRGLVDLYALLAALTPLVLLVYDAKMAQYAVDQECTTVRAVTPFDELSGVASRLGLLAEIRRHIALAHAHNERFLAVTVDIQGVKVANIAAGSHVGNALIAFTACVLDNAFWPDGFVGRIKGDEFVVLLPLNMMVDPASITSTLEEHIQQESWRLGTSSYGLYVDVVNYDPQRRLSVEQFLATCEGRATIQKKFSTLVKAPPTIVAHSRAD